MYYDTRTATARTPQRTEVKLSDGFELSRPADGWTDALLEACGLVPISVEPRPADTDTTTHDLTVELVDGVPTQVWTERNWTQAELDARATQAAREAHDTFLRGAIDTLETWSAQADAHVVTSGNAIATVQTITDNLAIFYDGFAKLLRNQYGIDD